MALYYNNILNTFNVDDKFFLEKEDEIYFKFELLGSSTFDFTASLISATLEIYSDAAGNGLSSLEANNDYIEDINYYTTYSVPNNVVVLKQNLSSFYGGNWRYVPNPTDVSGSVPNVFYDQYGDIEYDFVSKPYDILVIVLKDSTLIESRIQKIELNGGRLWIYLDGNLTVDALEQLQKSGKAGAFNRLLWITRKEDETNIYSTFSKRPGQTSYGFIIPENLAPDILAKIDIITKEVKQKLLADQQGNISTTP